MSQTHPLLIPEILTRIFVQLCQRQLLHQITLVCQLWRQVAWEEIQVVTVWTPDLHKTAPLIQQGTFIGPGTGLDPDSTKRADTKKSMGSKAPPVGAFISGSIQQQLFRQRLARSHTVCFDVLLSWTLQGAQDHGSELYLKKCIESLSEKEAGRLKVLVFQKGVYDQRKRSRTGLLGRFWNLRRLELYQACLVELDLEWLVGEGRPVGYGADGGGEEGQDRIRGFGGQEQGWERREGCMFPKLQELVVSCRALQVSNPSENMNPSTCTIRCRPYPSSCSSAEVLKETCATVGTVSRTSERKVQLRSIRLVHVAITDMDSFEGFLKRCPYLETLQVVDFTAQHAPTASLPEDDPHWMVTRLADSCPRLSSVTMSEWKTRLNKLAFQEVVRQLFDSEERAFNLRTTSSTIETGLGIRALDWLTLNAGQYLLNSQARGVSVHVNHLTRLEILGDPERLQVVPPYGQLPRVVSWPISQVEMERRKAVGKSLHRFLCESPHLMYLTAIEIVFEKSVFDVTHSIRPISSESVLSLAETVIEEEEEEVPKVWACRNLYKLHFSLDFCIGYRPLHMNLAPHQKSHRHDPQICGTSSRVVFAYLANVLPKLRDVCIPYSDLCLDLESGLCFLSGLKDLESLTVVSFRNASGLVQERDLYWAVETTFAKTNSWQNLFAGTGGESGLLSVVVNSVQDLAKGSWKKVKARLWLDQLRRKQILIGKGRTVEGQRPEKADPSSQVEQQLQRGHDETEWILQQIASLNIQDLSGVIQTLEKLSEEKSEGVWPNLEFLYLAPPQYPRPPQKLYRKFLGHAALFGPKVLATLQRPHLLGPQGAVRKPDFMLSQDW